MKNLYFAYGSNMDAAQMTERCPNSKLIGPASLKGYQLGFTIYSAKRNCGCADIVPCNGGEVHGLVYELSDKDLAALDRFEGAPTKYHRIQVKVMSHSTEEEMNVFTYEVLDKTSGLQPSAEYLALLIGAAELHGFPIQYCRKLHSVCCQNLNIGV